LGEGNNFGQGIQSAKPNFIIPINIYLNQFLR